MTVSILYIVWCVLIFLMALKVEDKELLEYLNFPLFVTAFGIAGICSRLDSLIEEYKKHRKGDAN